MRDSASHSLAEQVDSREYNKNKVYHRGRPQLAFCKPSPVGEGVIFADLSANMTDEVLLAEQV